MRLPAVHFLSDHDHSGYGVGARRLILGLEKIGCPIRWTPIGRNRTDRADPLAVVGNRDRIGLGRLEGSPIEPDVVIVRTIPERVPPLERVRPPGVPLVVATVWEHWRVQPHWPDLLNRYDAVVVPTRWNADAFAAAGVRVPILVVPHAHAYDPLSAKNARLNPIFDDGAMLFHSIAQWGRRKDPGRTVMAFARAFGPTDGVRLVLKTSHVVDGDVPVPAGPEERRFQPSWSVAAILARHAPAPPVHLVTAPQTHDWIASLHARSDCWLSLPHAEGWDLGCFDAAVAGCPVITTGYGGPLEYLDPAVAYLIPGIEVAHHVLPDTVWLDPDVDAAVEALRAVRADPAEARVRAEKQAEGLRARYAPEVVAADLVAGLRDVGLI
ncbi:MAG TPA: hypothetical protein VGJ14_14315 [Sporichthyaceae bacterium]